MQKVVEIIDRLKENRETISFAESCTGGLLASTFTAISGVSTVFNGSVVSYSNEIKHKWLKVDNKILENFGAVSSQCVEEMLKGIKSMSSSDYAIAISGIAGPTGGSELKPVGTVYIGVITPNDIKVERFLFDGDRENIQKEARDMAILMIYREIIEKI
ncbi:Hypothetical domain / C-terminal domain of CinA type S [hydrothermal vent metagenome]|uniref:Hypothetical domain / C-terminal domain of CinA type S n=1 Tax=hydrothermal vent metagenome TaxID=652676 RepID=A0A1W1EHB7_9ZZZZ